MEIVRHMLWSLPVYTVHSHDALSTTLEIFVKAGSIYEKKSTNWISHFLEHMFFKGWVRYPTPMAVAQTIDAFGGECNAYTSDEYAGYYIKCAPEHIPVALDVLADMLVNAQFPHAELEREKGVVIQEIKMYEDMPQRNVVHKWQEWYYGNSSYGWSTLWPVENIQRFSQDDLFAHKQSLYTKDNMCIVLSGALPELDQYLSLIAELFGWLPEVCTYPTPALVPYKPTQKFAYHRQNTQQHHLIISADGIHMHDSRRYACGLLTTLLGGNMSSRLFQEIREKRGLCYYVHAQHHAWDSEGVFMIRAGIEKERWKYGRDALIEEINSVAQGSIREEEFETARGNMLGTLRMWLETSDQIASFVWWQALFKDKVMTMQEIINAYQRVTLDDVKEVAHLLAHDNLYSYWIE
jgi:predicted Zn-dependent peptidase